MALSAYVVLLFSQEKHATNEIVVILFLSCIRRPPLSPLYWRLPDCKTNSDLCTAGNILKPLELKTMVMRSSVVQNLVCSSWVQA